MRLLSNEGKYLCLLLQAKRRENTSLEKAAAEAEEEEEEGQVAAAPVAATTLLEEIRAYAMDPSAVTYVGANQRPRMDTAVEAVEEAAPLDGDEAWREHLRAVYETSRVRRIQEVLREERQKMAEEVHIP